MYSRFMGRVLFGVTISPSRYRRLRSSLPYVLLRECCFGTREFPFKQHFATVEGIGTRSASFEVFTLTPPPPRPPQSMLMSTSRKGAPEKKNPRPRHLSTLNKGGGGRGGAGKANCRHACTSLRVPIPPTVPHGTVSLLWQCEVAM